MNLAEQLWPEWTRNKRTAHVYALECMAHRFRKFGFEKSINLLDPKSLLAISTIIHQPMADACLQEAVKRDPSLHLLIHEPFA